MGALPNRIDLFSKADGIEFESAWTGRTPVDLVVSSSEVRRIHYLGLADLVAAKEAAGRPKDLDDLRYLKKLLEERQTNQPD